MSTILVSIFCVLFLVGLVPHQLASQNPNSSLRGINLKVVDRGATILGVQGIPESCARVISFLVASRLGWRLRFSYLSHYS